MSFLVRLPFYEQYILVGRDGSVLRRQNCSILFIDHYRHCSIIYCSCYAGQPITLMRSKFDDGAIRRWINWLFLIHTELPRFWSVPLLLRSCAWRVDAHSAIRCTINSPITFGIAESFFEVVFYVTLQGSVLWNLVVSDFPIRICNVYSGWKRCNFMCLRRSWTSNAVFLWEMGRRLLCGCRSHTYHVGHFDQHLIVGVVSTIRQS